MAIDDTYVVNLALAHLGESTVDNLMTPGSMTNAARKVVLHLEPAKDAVLARHPWLCATKRVSIEESPDLGDWKYAHGYLAPGDFIRAFDVRTTLNLHGQPVMWEAGSGEVDGAERKVIRASASGPILLSYVRRAGWLAFFPQLTDAVALELAARACQPINGSVDAAKALKQKADQAVMLAQGFDNTQEDGQEPAIFDELAALRGGC